MTVGGWITMSVSICAFAGLFVWCMLKVLMSDAKSGGKPAAQKRGKK